MTDTSSPVETVATKLKGELGRRLVHASGAGLPILYLLGVPWDIVRVLFVICAVGTMVLEYLRLTVGLDWFIYRHLTREYEQDSIAGYMQYMVSSAVVAVIFEPLIAIPAVLMLMLGDPISGMLSSGELRKVKRPRSLAGMFLVCAVIATPFLYETPLAIVLGALGGTIADGVKPMIGDYIVDDNLTIAPLAAIAIWIGLELTVLL